MSTSSTYEFLMTVVCFLDVINDCTCVGVVSRYYSDSCGMRLWAYDTWYLQ